MSSEDEAMRELGDDDPDWVPDEQDEDNDSEMDDDDQETNDVRNQQQDDDDDDDDDEILFEYDEDTQEVRIISSRPPTLAVLRRLIQSRRARRPTASRLFQPAQTPNLAGVALLWSGEFGTVPKSVKSEKDNRKRVMGRGGQSVGDLLVERMGTKGRWSRATLSEVMVPNSMGTEVACYRDNVYSGQFSDDGSFFYSCVQDFKVYIYDTRSPPLVGQKSVYDSPPPPQRARRRPWESEDYRITSRTSLRIIKTVKAREEVCSWTITDANLSPKNDFLIYSSITPVIHLVPTRDSLAVLPGQSATQTEDEQFMLDFSTRGQQHFGLWSVRFSGDAREIVAGGNRYGGIYVYDIEARKTTLNVVAHRRDVNAVAFADEGSSNVLISGSDDTFVKVWDRRSLADSKPSGVLIGHTEGVTYVESKGDGRYALSNGKDQGARLWDLRKMRSSHDFENLDRSKLDVGIPGWDYRGGTYEKPQFEEHPLEGSVMIYRGHSVLRTLIRAHFSPVSQTGQQYIYSGSADGRIHIWNLDGTLKSRIDRHSTLPLTFLGSKQYNDPSLPDPAKVNVLSEGSMDFQMVVRDVAWHPFEPYLISTCWGSNTSGFDGSLAKHEWKAWGTSYQSKKELGDDTL